MGQRVSGGAEHRVFVERLLIAAAVAVLLLLLWQLIDLLVLIFGALVIAVLMRVTAEPIARWTGLGQRSSLAVAVMLIASATAILLFAFGAQIAAQFKLLARGIPQGWADAEHLIGSWPLGADLLRTAREGVPSGTNIMARLGDLVLTVGSAVADFVLIAIGAIFFAAQPSLYRTGFIKLFPVAWRGPVADAVDDSGGALRLWVKAQLISMVIVGLLTWAGLAIAGVPGAFALGSIAALLEIIPYVGPILSAIPGLLLALLLGPEKAMWALAVYVAVQQFEGNVLQPLVQRKVVTLPPAVTLFGMVAAGLLFGFVGLVFAAPASVVAYVLLKRLYIRELLHTATRVPGEDL
jgi:predicted PurR-regulated permease PerM